MSGIMGFLFLLSGIFVLLIIVVVHQNTLGRAFQIVELAAFYRPEHADDNQQHEDAGQQKQEAHDAAHGATNS